MTLLYCSTFFVPNASPAMCTTSAQPCNSFPSPRSFIHLLATHGQLDAYICISSAREFVFALVHLFHDFGTSFAKISESEPEPAALSECAHRPTQTVRNFLVRLQFLPGSARLGIGPDARKHAEDASTDPVPKSARSNSPIRSSPIQYNFQNPEPSVDCVGYHRTPRRMTRDNGGRDKVSCVGMEFKRA
ncbi:hypothetical protein EDB87DRAFT_1166662 [Lactarius vividus]|nr:hypothetical protein EDB87DRAFT_1166662 [Lactarius vividus]